MKKLTSIIAVLTVSACTAITPAHADLKETLTNNFNASQGNPTKVSKERLKQFYTDNFEASQRNN
jgi:hypothetical protein